MAREPNSRTRAFWLGLLAVSAFKVWLIAGEDIHGSATGLDAIWYLRAAKDWYWGMPYDWLAFIRPPAYPLWVAFVHAAGVPLRIATELLQLGGFLLLIIALRRAGLPNALCVAAYAACALHPATFLMNGYSMADTFYGAVLPYAMAGLLFVFLTQKLGHAMWTGFALAVLWNTREEGVLLIVLLLGYGIICWVAKRPRMWRSLGVIIATAAALTSAFYTANRHTFKAFARSAMSAPSFTGAYRALLAIKPTHSVRYVPITREARLRAYEVSPGFAKLKRFLEGETGNTWATETFRQLGVRDEIAAGWMPWALRNAANNAGQHESAANAAGFYRRVAREVETALRDGRLPRRAVWAGLLAPDALESLRYVPASFLHVVQLFFESYPEETMRDDEILTPEERALYDEMARRRPAPPQIWMLRDAPRAVRQIIDRVHAYVVLVLSAAAAVSLVLSAARGRKITFWDPLPIAAALLLLVIASRVALFALLDATSWPCALVRYVYPVLPLYSCAALLLIAIAARERSLFAALPKRE